MPARIFTWSRTNPPKYSREDIIPKVNCVSFIQLSIIDGFDVTRNVRSCRTSDLTWYVRLDPLYIPRMDALSLSLSERRYGLRLHVKISLSHTHGDPEY